MKWVTDRRISLYGLGIPPAQYEALSGGEPMSAVLRSRLERLTCDFPLRENYFAWQAFGRAYAPGASGPLPPYLEERHYAQLRSRADRVDVRHASLTDVLHAHARRKRPSLRVARCAGLDDGRAAECVVGCDHSRGSTRRPSDLPHRRPRDDSAGPDQSRHTIAVGSMLTRGRWPLARSTAPQSMAVSTSMTLQISTEAADTGTSHQQAMDRMYRLQRHIYDASRRYYLLGRDRLVADLDVPRGGTVLEIGCGTGRNLIQVARRYPHASLFGFDISEEMLKSAGSAIARSELTDRIRFAQGDALTFDAQRTFGVASFDRVYISYTLSMIPQWKAALAHASSMLAPGGRLHIADFGQCEGLAQVFRTGLFAWLRLFHVEPRKDLREVVTELADAMGGSTRFDAGHRGYDWHLSLRAADCHSEKH